MAQRVVTHHTCDICQHEGTDVETVSFGYRSKQYEIDLCPDHATALDEEVSPYIEHGRRAGTSGKPARQSGPDAKIVREWARAQGIAVPERGRLPKTIVEAYGECAA